MTLFLHICANTTPPLENARGVNLRAFTPYAAAYCFSQQLDETADCRAESPNIECSTTNFPQGPKCLGDSPLAPSSSAHLTPLTLLQCSHSARTPSIIPPTNPNQTKSPDKAQALRALHQQSAKLPSPTTAKIAAQDSSPQSRHSHSKLQIQPPTYHQQHRIHSNRHE